MDGFAVYLDSEGPETRITLVGDLDLATADDVRSVGKMAVQARDATTIAFDLSQVTFMDSTGLGALLAIRSAGEEVGIKVRIDKASDPVARIVALTGLTDAFDLIAIV